jgi:hypothetical protein
MFDVIESVNLFDNQKVRSRNVLTFIFNYEYGKNSNHLRRIEGLRSC